MIFAPVLMMVIWRYSLGACCGRQHDPQVYLQTHLDLALHGLTVPVSTRQTENVKVKLVLLLSLSLSLLLAACGEKPTEAPPAAAAPIAVGVVRFAELGFHPERDAPATLLGKNETRIAAEASARIVAIAVDSGDAVKAGQVLVRLDAKDAELALARAEAGLAQSAARLAQAEAQMGQARSLREKNFISAEALTLRETELTATRADVQSARASRDSARRGVRQMHRHCTFQRHRACAYRAGGRTRRHPVLPC